MTALKYVSGVIAALCALLLLLYGSLYLSAFNAGFYDREFEKNGTPLVVGMDSTELSKVAGQLISYLKLETDELNIDVVVDGKLRPFFSEREIYHMSDVKQLFGQGQFLAYTAFILIIAALSLLLFIKADLKRILTRSFFFVFAAFLALSVLLLAIIAIDFERAFILFHELFFSNDLWLLDPRYDLLINIVPLQFFIDISIKIACLFYGSAATLTALSAVLVKRLPKARLE